MTDAERAERTLLTLSRSHVLPFTYNGSAEHRKGLAILREAFKALRDELLRDELMPYLIHLRGCAFQMGDTATVPRRCTCGYLDLGH